MSSQGSGAADRPRHTDVVVTGLGATTPLGADVASTWDAMLAGRSGVRALTHKWAAQLPSTVTADNPSRYPEPITAQGYLEERLREIKLK